MAKMIGILCECCKSSDFIFEREDHQDDDTYCYYLTCNVCGLLCFIGYKPVTHVVQQLEFSDDPNDYDFKYDGDWIGGGE